MRGSLYIGFIQVFSWINSIPMTGMRKIDKKALKGRVAG